MSSTEPFVLINSFELPEGSDEFRAAAAAFAGYRSHPGLYRIVGG